MAYILLFSKMVYSKPVPYRPNDSILSPAAKELHVNPTNKHISQLMIIPTLELYSNTLFQPVYVTSKISGFSVPNDYIHAYILTYIHTFIHAFIHKFTYI